MIRVILAFVFLSFSARAEELTIEQILEKNRAALSYSTKVSFDFVATEKTPNMMFVNAGSIARYGELWRELFTIDQSPVKHSYLVAENYALTDGVKLNQFDESGDGKRQAWSLHHVDPINYSRERMNEILGKWHGPTEIKQLENGIVQIKMRQNLWTIDTTKECFPVTFVTFTETTRVELAKVGERWLPSKLVINTPVQHTEVEVTGTTLLEKFDAKLFSYESLNIKETDSIVVDGSNQELKLEDLRKLYPIKSESAETAK